MFDTKGFLKWLSALGVGVLAVCLAFIGQSLGAFDPATVTSDPIVAAVVAAVIAAATRGVNWLIGRLPA